MRLSARWIKGREGRTPPVAVAHDGPILEMHTMKKTMKGAAIASAVASMFAFAAYAGDAAAPTKAGDAKIKCAGVNACKSMSACAGANNACAKQNSCKGKGISMVTEKECKAQKGTVVADKK